MEETTGVIGNRFTDSTVQADSRDSRDVMGRLHRVRVQASSVNHSA